MTAGFIATPAARAVSYTLTSMVPAGFYTSGEDNYPAINDLGQVASIGYDAQGGEQIGLSNGTTTLGMVPPAAYGSIGSALWLNNAGQVTTRSYSDILSGATNAIAPLPNNTGWTLNYDALGAANVPNSPVAWVGYQSSARALYITTGAQSQLLLTNGSLYEDIFAPFINPAGTVCYTVQLAKTTNTAIYTTNGTTTRLVAASSGTPNSIDIGLGLDNAGDVLWRENLGDHVNSRLWITSPTGTNTLVADTTGGYASFGDPYTNSASLSGNGKVAFVATLKNGLVGVFTGADPVANKVLEQGDPLFGGTAGAVFSIGSDGLNSSGSIAFLANTQNGSFVVRADVTPEPATLLALSPAVFSLLKRRRKPA